MRVGFPFASVASESELVRITEIFCDGTSRFAVNTFALSPSEAIHTGLVPTGMVFVTVKVKLLITLTEFDPVFAT
jgi:hypothetical protein